MGRFFLTRTGNAGRATMPANARQQFRRDRLGGSARIDDAAARFEQFSRFFCEVFTTQDLLHGTSCDDNFREYVPVYYAKLFGPGIDPLSKRHIKWFRRLAPLLSLPPKATILDYGGGYGMDTIFLASLGYRLYFYEVDSRHIEVARWFATRFGERFGELEIRFLQARKDADPANLDAIFLNEVAHHIEPPTRAFAAAARMLRPGGSLFLLEPNFWCPVTQAVFFKLRGFRTVFYRADPETGEFGPVGNENIRPVARWNRYARRCGFSCIGGRYVIPWFWHQHGMHASLLRRSLEELPLIRDLLASHVTVEYVNERRRPAAPGDIAGE